MVLGRIRRKLFPNQPNEVDFDARALQLLAPLREPYKYIPWTRASLRPGAVQFLVNDIVVNRRQTVVDLGAGISTLLIAVAIQGTDTRLISVDQDPDWLAFLRTRLGNLNLAENVALVHCPLQDVTVEGGAWSYYAMPPLLEALDGRAIDVLSVDGPAAYQAGQAMARYPAVPLLRERLAERYTVVLDDAARAGEREIARRWSALLGVEPEDLIASCGLVAWHRGHRFYPGP
jgi:hypothetical protein